MKTYENLRGKRADVRGRQVRANKILPLLSPLARSYSLRRPFTSSLPASRFIRFCRASSLADVRLRIYTFPYRRAEEESRRRSGEILPRTSQRLDCRNELEIDGLLGINAWRGYRSRGSFAFQLADSCSEGTLIGWQEARKNEIIANQYAPRRSTLPSQSVVAVQRSVYSCPQDLRSSTNFARNIRAPSALSALERYKDISL